MKEEKLVKHSISESSFTKSEIKQILSSKETTAQQINLDCKAQVIQQVGVGVFEIIVTEVADRKTKFGIMKIFRIGKAVIKIIEEAVVTWRACNKPV